MFSYEKKLQYPVKIANPNPKLAAMIISQYGGPNINRLRNPEHITPAFHSTPVNAPPTLQNASEKAHGVSLWENANRLEFKSPHPNGKRHWVG